MNISEKIDNLKNSQKAVIMTSVFAIIEFFYIIQFESKSIYFRFYITLVMMVWFVSFLVCVLYAEYVEKPEHLSSSNADIIS